MTQWLTQLAAVSPDADTEAKFRTELLKLCSLYGIKVNELHAKPHPFLRALEGGKTDGGDAA